MRCNATVEVDAVLSLHAEPLQVDALIAFGDGDFAACFVTDFTEAELATGGFFSDALDAA